MRTWAKTIKNCKKYINVFIAAPGITRAGIAVLDIFKLSVKRPMPAKTRIPFRDYLKSLIKFVVELNNAGFEVWIPITRPIKIPNRYSVTSIGDFNKKTDLEFAVVGKNWTDF